MRRLLTCGVTFPLLTLSCLQLSAQRQPEKPIASLYDLELKMPRDHVLAGLAGHYKLKEEFDPPPDDPSKGWDAWTVFSGDDYVGEVLFQDGRLAGATVKLYTTDDGGDRELVDKLFAALFGSSGKSTIDEKSATELTRERSATIYLESVEQTLGKYQSKILKFQVGPRLFILSVTTRVNGSRHVRLEESITKEWRQTSAATAPSK